MAGNGRGRLAGLVLLALGPVLVTLYAGLGLLAVRGAAAAQIADPAWAGGRISAGGLTSLGVDAWRMTWWTALLVGVVALAYTVIGLLLRRPLHRGRAFLLVLSGFLIFPYALGFVVALVNPAKLLAGLYGASGFVSGLPSWQPAAAFLLLGAGAVQSVGLVVAAAQGRRASAARPPA